MAIPRIEICPQQRKRSLSPSGRPGLALLRPNGSILPLERLPVNREEAVGWARDSGAGPGRHDYVRWTGPLDGDFYDKEMSVCVYADSRAGVTLLFPGAADFSAVEEDVASYVLGMVDKAARPPVKAVLSAQDGHPLCDMEANRVSLVLLSEDGEPLVEFLLEPTGWLELADTPEQPGTALFCCSLPSVRSVVQFVKVAIEAMGMGHAMIRHYAFNDVSPTRFG